MKDKKLRSLSRADLLELLCRLKKSEEELQEQVKTLQAQLADRTLNIEKAGTLAEAALATNGVFDAAQRAADQYAEQAKTIRAEAERRCAVMVAETEAACRRREEETVLKINQKWAEFQQKIQNYMQVHSDLESMQTDKSSEVNGC